MYQSAFINCCGSNIYTTLGALDRLKKEVENVTIWNVCGNASLILYYKLIGLTAKQTYEKLKSLDIINSLINGHSLLPENQEEKIEYIKNYLTKSLKNSLLKEDSTLEEVKKLTDITPCFIVWNRSQGKIENLNPKDNPRMKLIDCVMATLVNIGVFNTYKINNSLYSSLENIECFPVSHTYYNDIEELFYLVNITQYIKEYSLGNNMGPLKETEDELLLQKGEYNKFRIEKNCKALPHSENVCKLYSIFSRGNSKEEEKASLFILGFKLADGFEKKKDTHLVYKEYLESIFSQS